MLVLSSFAQHFIENDENDIKLWEDGQRGGVPDLLANFKGSVSDIQRTPIILLRFHCFRFIVIKYVIFKISLSGLTLLIGKRILISKLLCGAIAHDPYFSDGLIQTSPSQINEPSVTS